MQSLEIFQNLWQSLRLGCEVWGLHNGDKRLSQRLQACASMMPQKIDPTEEHKLEKEALSPGTSVQSPPKWVMINHLKFSLELQRITT